MHWKRILSLAFLPILVPALLAGSALAAEDTIALSHPTVSVPLPTEGSTVSGTVGLSAICVDDQGCTEVRYFVDDVQVASDSTSPDWSEGWDTTSVADGEHTIYATGRDAAGNVARSPSVRFTVQNGPAVSVLAPVAGTTVSGTIALIASCTGCADVRYFVDGVQVASDGTSPEWSEGWDTTSVADGEHTIYATGRDAAGNVARSASVRFTVQNGLLWSTGAENGYPGEWGHQIGSWDSGYPIDGYTELSTEQKRSGNYSFKQVMTNNGDSGTRLPRTKEPSTYRELYYSTWVYIPKFPTNIATHFNFMQWKGKNNVEGSQVIWGLYFHPSGLSAPQFRLTDKSERYSTGGSRHHDQTTPVIIPQGRWFNVTVRYISDPEPETTAKADSTNTGRITVWQDGAQIFDVQNKVTAWTYNDATYPQPWTTHWTVNAYGEGIEPGDYFHYIDDVSIAQ